MIGRMVLGTVWEPDRTVLSSLFMCYPGTALMGQYLLRKYFFPEMTGSIFVGKNHIDNRTPHANTFIFYDNILTIGSMVLGFIIWLCL